MKLFSQRSHQSSLAKVFDGRKQPIRTLWVRNGRFYAQLKIEKILTGLKKLGASRYPTRKYMEWVEALTESAELVFPAERATGATPDPDDEIILECALAAEADFIVSGDKKHLLALRQFQGIPIINPVEFLRRLGD